ncbi:MAG: hypothetical protein K2N14_02195 [Clostridia bacterium]|nr:hypothetical protein [Clostridia bacterium]
MKSKKLICAAVAVAVVMGASLSTTGCVSTISERDVKQTVATVNISNDESFSEEYGKYAAAISDEVFTKRDLIISYFNGYYVYNTQYGYSMADTVELIKDSLVQTAVMTQYATVELLKYKAEEEKSLSLDTFNGLQTQKEKYEYLLGGEDSKGVKTAKYNLYLMFNNALDSYEKLKLEDKDEYKGSGTRATPAGIDTTDEDYIPENYYIYTGYEGYLLDGEEMSKAVENGDYEPLDNTNKNTRRAAYADFISMLKSNYYISEEDAKLTDILNISYAQNEYVNQLQNQIVQAFNDVSEKKQVEKIDTIGEDGIYTYIEDKYKGLEDGYLTAQEQQYSNPTNTSAFETAMGNVSDTSFILYSPATTEYSENIDGTYGTFGYVYNILLPFSSTQETTLKTYQSYQSSGRIDDNAYFRDRNQLLKAITTTDQREAWFNGDTQYAFNAAEYNKDKEESDKLSYYNGGNEDRKYLFFENNLTKSGKYESLEKYAGMYSYNGKVTENKNGSYKLVPNKLNIDDMLGEFKAYINFVMGTDSVEYNAGDKLDASATDFEAYYGETQFTKDNGKEVDYSKLVYATGKVTFTDGARENMFVADSDRYKAMSAVNELQYAYTTDTGVLSQYIGYTVSAYDTNYIKEFEYAAQQALRMGAGAFKVCAGDYGWHLIYVTETFDFNGGEVYKPVFNKERIEKEGTFENRFYNWYKDSSLTNEASLKRAEILKKFNNDSTVKVDKKAYKNITEIG